MRRRMTESAQHEPRTFSKPFGGKGSGGAAYDLSIHASSLTTLDEDFVRFTCAAALIPSSSITSLSRRSTSG